MDICVEWSICDCFTNSDYSESTQKQLSNNPEIKFKYIFKGIVFRLRCMWPCTKSMLMFMTTILG